MFHGISKLQKEHHGSAGDLAGQAQDLPSIEKATTCNRPKSSAILRFLSLQQLFYFLAIFMILPLIIFGGLKFLIAKTCQDSIDVNADIGAAVGTIIAMHIVIIVYIMRLVFLQGEKLAIWSKWDIIVSQRGESNQKRGPFVIVLLLLFYCLLIVAFPIFVFFALKFIVLKNLFSISNNDRDIISVIGAVIAVHIAVGFYIYRVYYYGGSNKSIMKNN